MAEPDPSAPTPTERIDAACRRIEAATRALAADRDALFRRHAALKASMVEAVAGIDALLAPPVPADEAAEED